MQLGRVRALLSTRDGSFDEGHFEEAEEFWDRPEDAAAYEWALELDPDSEEAKKKLDGSARRLESVAYYFRSS